MLESR
jgi:hypothetical protein